MATPNKPQNPNEIHAQKGVQHSKDNPRTQEHHQSESKVANPRQGQGDRTQQQPGRGNMPKEPNQGQRVGTGTQRGQDNLIGSGRTPSTPQHK